MNDCCQVRYPLDVIHFVSGKSKVVSFLNFLFKKAIEYNEKMEDRNGENFFPVLRFNNLGFLYEIEYEFFVEKYIEYAVEFYGIDEESEIKIKQFLMLSLDQKIIESRYLFFVIILGHYFRFGDKYYGDYCKNKFQIFITAVIENENGKYAHSRYIPIRNFIDEFLNFDDDILDKIKSYKSSVKVFGSKKVKIFLAGNNEASVKKIYGFA